MADYDLGSKQRPALFILCQDAAKAAALSGAADLIGTLALSDEVKVCLLYTLDDKAGCQSSVKSCPACHELRSFLVSSLGLSRHWGSAALFSRAGSAQQGTDHASSSEQSSFLGAGTQPCR